MFPRIRPSDGRARGSYDDLAVGERRWHAQGRPVGDSWRVDETYLKIKAQRVYLYRGVDKAGRTIDFLLSRRRHIAAAKRFFSTATKQHGAPKVIPLDGCAATHRAVAKLFLRVIAEFHCGKDQRDPRSKSRGPRGVWPVYRPKRIRLFHSASATEITL
jgi:transposase-like protein